MASYIEPVDFSKPGILLPNYNDAKVTIMINNHIAIYEPEFYERILGYEFAKLFIAAIATQPVSGDRFDKILNGSEYVDTYGRTQKWRGFKKSDDRNSPVASYIYTKIKAIEEQQSFGTSTGVMKADGAINASIGQLFVDAWNFMSREIYKLMDYIYDNIDLYPEITYTQICETKYYFKCINTFNW